MVISFRLPRISMGALSNLVGLAGLAAIAVAVGGLTGNWWWSALVGGVFGVGLAYLAGASEQAAEEPAARTPAAAGPRPVTAKAS